MTVTINGSGTIAGTNAVAGSSDTQIATLRGDI